MRRLALLLGLVVSVLPALAFADPPRAARPGPPPAVTAPAPASPDGVVNVNSASADELTRVPGIGPSRAEAIVRLRERVSRFRAVDDLLRVRGIGRVTLRRMRPYLALAGDTTLPERPGRRSRAGADAAPEPAVTPGAGSPSGP